MNTILYKGEEGVTDIAFVSCTDPDSSVRRVPFLGHQRISQRVLWTSLGKELDPKGSIPSRGVSESEFLRKPLATCEFLGGFRPPVTPLDPPMRLSQSFDF